MSEALEKELKQTQKKLKALEAEYQDFAYIIAHDLGAPLRSIEGFTSLITEHNADNFDEKTLSHFHKIIKNTAKCKSLLVAMLDFSQLQSAPHNPSLCDFNEIIDIVKQELTDLIKSTNATINVSHLPKITVDKAHLALAFYHLILNALTYQQKNTPVNLEISAEETNTHWHFIFKDNGIGIQPKLIQKILKPMRRGVKDSDYSGLGMGLTIVNKIAEKHNGTIQVNQSDNSGSVFILKISKTVDNQS
jgi:light-regulated signal transduction histidine kinase (bacteriophytochrome)